MTRSHVAPWDEWMVRAHPGRTCRSARIEVEHVAPPVLALDDHARALFGYDANGNLTRSGDTTYVYDAENRLVSASTGSGSGTSLSYDPLGRLWQVSGPAGTTRFVYDGDALVAEYDGGGTLLRRYHHLPGDDQPLVWCEGAGTCVNNGNGTQTCSSNESILDNTALGVKSRHLMDRIDDEPVWL